MLVVIGEQALCLVQEHHRQIGAMLIALGDEEVTETREAIEGGRTLGQGQREALEPQAEEGTV